MQLSPPPADSRGRSPAPMTGFPTANFSDSEQGLFSPLEIQRLMRIEFERARRYSHPIALMLIEVDRVDQIHNLYGFESKEEILHAVIGLLRSVTRASDFLGCMVDDRIMAVFPHTPEPAARALAGRLLSGSRKLDFRSDGRRLQATLSIGVSLYQIGDETAFEEFVRAAEDALRFAVESGGDRYVQRESALDLIQRLKGDLDREAEALSQERQAIETVGRRTSARPRSAPPPPAAPPAPAAPHPHDVSRLLRPLSAAGELPDDEVSQEVGALFAELGALTPELGALRDRVVELTKVGMRTARDRAIAEHASRVDVLERRIVKLRETLEKTESDLLHVARMKGIDHGVASVYRTVQGLAADAADFERKHEMLTLLFEANVELRKKIRDKS